VKKIFLCSDNHGFVDEAILHHAKQADEIWHAGDWLNMDLLLEFEKLNKPIRAVWGNADGQELRRIFKEHLYFQVEGVKVYMTHIGGYPGHYSPAAKIRIKEAKPDLFVCGHSHILRVIRDPANGNLLSVNPGACGKQGFHKVRTALRFQMENGKISEMAFIEFGTRNSI